MSFTLGAVIRQSTSLREIASGHSFYLRASLEEAQRVGVEYLQEHTPVLTGILLSTVKSGRNQSSVWFEIAGIIDGKPYGFAQEYGWHDRADRFHPGVHMVEGAGQAAADAFMAFMGAEVSTMARFNPGIHHHFVPGREVAFNG